MLHVDYIPPRRRRSADVPCGWQAGTTSGTVSWCARTGESTKDAAGTCEEHTLSATTKSPSASASSATTSADCRCLPPSTPPKNYSHAASTRCPELYTTRRSAIAERPRDASCQLKSCQLPRNSAETTCTTSPEQIKVMKL